MPVKLSVNLNAVAMLRNRRDLPWPSVTGLGRIALAAGAHGLTVHPRPDQRHTRYCDLPDLRALIDDEFPHAEFNIEGYPTEEFLALVEQNQPEQVTLVPDDPAQATSDHGWNFAEQSAFLTPVVRRLKKGGQGYPCSQMPKRRACRRRAIPAPIASSSIPAPMRASTPTRPRWRANSTSWGRRRRRRWRWVWGSMPGTIWWLRICRHW